MAGGGQDDGRGAGGNVLSGNAVNRRRIGDGMGSQGRGGAAIVQSYDRVKMKFFIFLGVPALFRGDRRIRV